MEIETIIERLKSLGYEYDEEKDKWAITEFLIPKVKNRILNLTNQSEIPDKLLNVAIDMVCGEFLLVKKNSGQFAIDSSKIQKELSSITEGKFTLSYAVNNDTESDDAKLNTLINYLMKHGEEELLCYRKLKW